MNMQKPMSVKNRSSSVVVYKVQMDNQTVRREFQPGETKTITYDELVKLSFKPGGRQLMEGFLQIQSKEAVNDLNLRVEPEYNMDENQIIELLKSGSMDAFLDCLDFAPTGVIDLLKKYAVELPLNDSAKRDALKEKTGFDVSTAIANAKAAKEDDDAPFKEVPNARRIKTEEASTPGRRTSGTNYKVVTTETPAE